MVNQIIRGAKILFVMKVCQLMKRWWNYAPLSIPDLDKREIAFESQRPGNFVRHLHFESEEVLRDTLINKCAVSLYHSVTRKVDSKVIRDVVVDIDVKSDDWKTSIELALEELKMLRRVIEEELGLDCIYNFSGSKGFHGRCFVAEDSPWAVMTKRGYEKLAAYLSSLPTLQYSVRGRIVDICQMHPLGSCYRAALQLQFRYVDMLVLTREEGLIRALWSINPKSGLAAVPLDTLDIDVEDLVDKASPVKEEYIANLKEKVKIPWGREVGPGRVAVNFHELLYLLFHSLL